jgi:hypothetical protein
MKTIQPISIWKDGSPTNATILKMYISYDDLESSAVFQYQLLTDTLEVVTYGSLGIGGSEYSSWGSSGDSNEEAYVFAATSLSLTITGEYTPPAPPAE